MALTTEALLDIWRTVLPESYVAPLEDENDGQGLDVIASIAEVFARVAVSVETTTQAMYVFPHSDEVAPPAAGGVQSSGTIDVTRVASTYGDVELLDGDPLSTLVRNEDGDDIVEIGVEVDGDQTIPGGSTSAVTVNVRSSRAGHHTNVEAGKGRSVRFLRRLTATVTDATTTALNVITAGADGDQFDEQMVGAFVRFTAGANVATYPRRVLSFDSTTGTVTVDGVALAASGGTESLEVVDLEELGLSAELSSDLDGGTSPWLDQIGDERLRGRNPGETDTSFRGRIRELPDIVAPNALYRACSRILTPLGIRFAFYESRGPEIEGAAWDYSPYDDLESAVGLTGRHNFWQGDNFQHRGFYVVVERNGEGDPGGCWDYDPGVGGVHPSSAFDFVLWDGTAYGFYYNVLSLVKEIESARMAGVPWLIVIIDSIP